MLLKKNPTKRMPRGKLDVIEGKSSGENGTAFKRWGDSWEADKVINDSKEKSNEEGVPDGVEKFTPNDFKSKEEGASNEANKVTNDTN